MTVGELSELNPDMVFWDGFDEAIIGTAERCGIGPVIAYDVNKVIQVLCDDMDLNEEDAWDWFNFNMNGAYLGEFTPMHIFINK